MLRFLIKDPDHHHIWSPKENHHPRFWDPGTYSYLKPTTGFHLAWGSMGCFGHHQWPSAVKWCLVHALSVMISTIWYLILQFWGLKRCDEVMNFLRAGIRSPTDPTPTMHLEYYRRSINIWCKWEPGTPTPSPWVWNQFIQFNTCWVPPMYQALF